MAICDFVAKFTYFLYTYYLNGKYIYTQSAELPKVNHSFEEETPPFPMFNASEMTAFFLFQY